jgi:hypothetical protein
MPYSERNSKKHIQRGKQVKYKPFWNNNLKEQKIRRDKAREKAEISKLLEDVIEWIKRDCQT